MRAKAWEFGVRNFAMNSRQEKFEVLFPKAQARAASNNTASSSLVRRRDS